VEPAHAEGPWWHGDDRALAPPGVRAGWHDAGDLSIYTATTTIALFWLLQTYADLRPEDDDTNLPESGNGVPDLLDEARWGLTWLLSVQTAVGAFRNSTCQERYGPYGTNAPTAVPPYVAGEVGTLPTGRAVGTLAFAAHVFRPGDPAFAARLLEAARRGYAYLAARPGERSDGVTCGAYGTAGSAEVDSGVRAYAAAGMLLATGEPSYADDFARTRRAVRPESSYQNLTAFAALLYLRAGAGRPATRAALAAELDAVADRLLDQAARHPFEFPIGYPWGSLGAAFTATGSFNARRCLADPDGHARDCEAVLAAVHYALGRNGLGLCYVSGLRGVTAGRTSGFHQWLAALRADPHDFPGMVAGGPNARPEARDRSAPRARPLPIWGYFDDPRHPRSEATPLDGRFTDNDSWSTNEVAIDWQSASVYALHLARWAAHRGGAGGPGAQEPVEPTTGSASSGKGMPKSGLAPSPSTQR
jgi:endoglucanase